jgi:hypothetical protein
MAATPPRFRGQPPPPFPGVPARHVSEVPRARQEADIFAAQREGRIQGTPYLTK